MKIVYANITWFALLISGIVNSTINRHYSEQWMSMGDLRFYYDLLYGGISLILLASIIGLLLKRKWGYELTLTSNSLITLLLLGIFVLSIFILPSLTMVELLRVHITNIFAGFVSLVFWVLQVRSGIKAMYNH